MQVVCLAPNHSASQEWTPATARLLGLRYVVEQKNRVLTSLAHSTLEAVDDLARDLDAVLVNLHEPLFTYPQILERLKAMKVIRRPSRILDYGCGAGYYSIAMALAGQEVACWDPNPTALACVEYTGRALGLKTKRGTVTGSYDAAFCINVLDHTSRPEECLDAIESALSPGAQLYLHADFHPDGMHVSGKEAVARAFAAIATRFERDYEISDLLQVWRKREARSAFGDGLMPQRARLKDLDLRPTMSEAVELQYTQEGGAIVAGKVFYIRACHLAPPAAQILNACDGMTSIREIVQSMKPLSMSPRDTCRVIAELWERRIVRIKGLTP